MTVNPVWSSSSQTYEIAQQSGINEMIIIIRGHTYHVSVSCFSCWFNERQTQIFHNLPRKIQRKFII